MPATPVTSTARAIGSERHSSNSPVSTPSSRSRPTHGVGLPSSVRVAWTTSRSRTRYRPSSSPPTSNRASRSPAVTSSSRTPPRARPADSRAAARSIASPTSSLPARIPRPVATAIAPSGRSAERASAHRAAWIAWSDVAPLPSSVTTSEPSAIRCRRAPCVSAASRRALRSGPCGSNTVSGPSARSRSSAPVRGAGPRPSISGPGSEGSLGRVSFGSTATVWSASTRTTQTRRRSFAVSDPRAGARSTAAGVPISASSAASWVPSRGRSSAFFESVRATRSSSASGRSVRIAPTRGASSSKTLASTAIMLSPANGGLPVRHSNSRQPSANTSARGPTVRSPRACSGAM